MLLTQKSFEEIYDLNTDNVVSYLQKENCIGTEDSKIFYQKNIDGHAFLHLKYEELRNSLKLMHEQAKKIEKLIKRFNEERYWEKICRIKAPIDIRNRLEHCGIHLNSSQAVRLMEANITGEELLFEEPERFSKLDLGDLLTQIKSIRKRIGKLMLQRAFHYNLIHENDEVTFQKSTNEKEPLGKVSARNGMAYIEYNKKIFLSFNKFMKAYLKRKYSPFPKQRYNFFIGDKSYETLKQELKLNEDMSEKMNKLNLEEESRTEQMSMSSENIASENTATENMATEDMDEREYITNQAVLVGFIRDKFSQWLSSISDDILATQTPEYWLFSYVSEMENNTWNEDISPSIWLASCFAITQKTADTIVNSVSEDYLQNQTPRYWINEWISQQTNPVSPEFIAFIESASANKAVSYEGSNLFIVDKMPASGDDEELNLLLSESCSSSDNHTYYFHTTNRNHAESIIKSGIDVGRCYGNQDFGRSASFHLNDDFRCAVEWGRKRYMNPNSCVIFVYDIPKELLLKYDHLDLSRDPKKWKDVVRKSRNGIFNEADDNASVYGFQAENVKTLIKDKNAPPRQSDKNQLALKERKLTKQVDKRLIGTIIYRTKQY
ncbi:hypothetical protein RclHR1_02090009 [Rhizophagus clarus]|uniref:Uncharacterized protein n=1 Tax=Rhizophagus clarus TaxID=94130 RepID=A0A2Z6QU02_9GLOM|nr:hypothetical protein RclHR1_02090009 [Rhizophagus clarus]GES87717.1 hypothetical protein GLOIN_2v1484649 [Rhizophagus clarus]